MAILHSINYNMQKYIQQLHSIKRFYICVDGKTNNNRINKINLGTYAMKSSFNRSTNAIFSMHMHANDGQQLAHQIHLKLFVNWILFYQSQVNFLFRFVSISPPSIKIKQW